METQDKIITLGKPLPYSAGCFVCGSSENGLRARFHQHESTVVSEIVFDKVFQGFDGVVHGGIQASFLDEVALWAASLEFRDYMMTQSLDVKYVKPVRTDTRYLAKGHFLAKDGNAFSAEASIVDERGQVVCTASGVFRPMPSRLASEFEARVIYPSGGSAEWRVARFPKVAP